MYKLVIVIAASFVKAEAVLVNSESQSETGLSIIMCAGAREALQCDPVECCMYSMFDLQGENKLSCDIFLTACDFSCSPF